MAQRRYVVRIEWQAVPWLCHHEREKVFSDISLAIGEAILTKNGQG